MDVFLEIVTQPFLDFDSIYRTHKPSDFVSAAPVFRSAVVDCSLTIGAADISENSLAAPYPTIHIKRSLSMSIMPGAGNRIS